MDRFFRRQAPTEAGDLLLVAFSAGADSTALLAALARLSSRRDLRLHAAHLDHLLDPESGLRAERAAGISARLGVPITLEQRPVNALRRRGESLETAARRVRYEFLEERRIGLGARYLVTAHHRDDQAETVVLRLLLGSGLEGLAAIAPRRGPLVRPLLGLSRLELRAAALALELEPIEDPLNRDLGSLRNRVRHLLLPRLRRVEPDLDDRLARLAGAARAARRSLAARLERRLALRPLPGGGAALERSALEALDQALWPHALALLHRRSGAPYPAGRGARLELARQLAAGGAVGCDCGDGWRWRSRGALLALARRRPAAPSFAYTLVVPGELEISELDVRYRLRPAPVAAWMFEGSPTRAGLSLPLAAGDRVTIRSRRPGDRIKPLGCTYERRLKDLLIDRKVPREERGRLPLLCFGSRVAWVPGLTVDHDFRVAGDATAWLAEIEPK